MMHFKDQESFRRFLNCQAAEIKKHRDCECNRLGDDAGPQASLQWVKEHAREFRQEYFRAHPEDFSNE